MVRRGSKKDKAFYLALAPFSSTVVAVMVVLVTVMLSKAWPAISFYGPGLLLETRWSPSEDDPSRAVYGLLPAVLGTLTTALIAMALAVPASTLMVVFLEEILPRRLRGVYSNLIDVMAGTPTILYGLWGLTVLAPALNRYVYQGLYDGLGPWAPVFSCPPSTGGYNVLTASILLAVMITPFTFAIVKEAYESIPQAYKEAVAALGATRLEQTRILLSMIKPSVLAGALLGFGRAASETVAVALVVGNAANLPLCLLAPGYTISSLIANQFSEAGLHPMMEEVLFAGGLVLLLIGLASNSLGLWLLGRSRGFG